MIVGNKTDLASSREVQLESVKMWLEMEYPDHQ